jgi:triosephosphate isomerase (TIM)
MRKKIVAGNWKMNKTAAEAIALANEVAQLVKTDVSKDVQVIMAPPSLFISEVNKLFQASLI